jgi:hypothetical protein
MKGLKPNSTGKEKKQEEVRKCSQALGGEETNSAVQLPHPVPQVRLSVQPSIAHSNNDNKNLEIF